MFSLQHRKFLRTLRTTPLSVVDGAPPGTAGRSVLGLPQVWNQLGKLGRQLRGRFGGIADSALSTPGPCSLPFTGDAQVLLIVPPFASVMYPSLAAEILAACTRRAGYCVDILYANLLLAGFLGETTYEQIGNELTSLVGERFFARAAFGLPPLGRHSDRMFDPIHLFGDAWHDIRGEQYRNLYTDTKHLSLGRLEGMTLERLYKLEQGSTVWVGNVVAAIAARGYRIVGCTTTFQQTTAGIALLNGIKSIKPETITALGGANCEGEMAEGMVSLGSNVDYIFSGESEETFPEFVGEIMAGRRPARQIIAGRPCPDMDALPFLSCKAFFEQRQWLRQPAPAASVYLSFETSRGCWWGQKQHCTFCGLNGEGMGFRQKSPNRVIEELRALVAESPTRNITMTDNIMPRGYFKHLLPRLREELPGLQIFYEQKANLSLPDMITLKEAGITSIQPGIEALSSKLLKLMRKGVDARQNLLLLRYARITGVRLIWNLICGFPNDLIDCYRETLALIPLIVHLQPPSGLWHLSIDRFSPYFFEPSAHQVQNLRPLPVYRDIFPESTDFSKIAYHFLGDYPCDTHRYIDLVQRLSVAVRKWGREWEKPYGARPELKLGQRQGRITLLDTRGLPGTDEARNIEADEAKLLMNACAWRDSDEEKRAVRDKLAVHVDNWFVPLPVAPLDLFLQLSAERQKPSGSVRLKRQPDKTGLDLLDQISLGSSPRPAPPHTHHVGDGPCP
jgi:ribosomal peptide maturation radical SAM protein 1